MVVLIAHNYPSPQCLEVVRQGVLGDGLHLLLQDDAPVGGIWVDGGQLRLLLHLHEDEASWLHAGLVVLGRNDSVW